MYLLVDGSVRLARGTRAELQWLRTRLLDLIGTDGGHVIWAALSGGPVLAAAPDVLSVGPIKPVYEE
jgi:hypothetical protein